MSTNSSLSRYQAPKRRSSVTRARSWILALGVVAVAACGGDGATSPPRFADPASAAVSAREKLATVHWNEITQDAIGRNRPSQNAAWRVLAYVTLAQHVAVEEAAAKRGVTRSMMRGAVAGATAPVLSHFFAADQALIEAAVRAEEASVPQGQRAGFRAAELDARAIGGKVIARAQSDRFGAPWNGEVPVGPGKWSSLSNPPVAPFLPLGGEVLPFFMSAGSQFRPSPPPAFGTPAFNEAVGEVRRISDTRTALQDSLAKFWALPTGGLIVGYWNTTAIELITTARLGERAAAHVLALMNTAGQDALIACHDTKYAYWLVRPSGADLGIRTSVGVPNHPSYPSNHSCISGTSANVLGAMFPAARERLQQKAYEAGMSRVYGGLHYRFDSDAGLEIARRVAELAIFLDQRNQLVRLMQP